jgi:hypothetical protein
VSTVVKGFAQVSSLLDCMPNLRDAHVVIHQQMARRNFALTQLVKLRDFKKSLVLKLESGDYLVQV